MGRAMAAPANTRTLSVLLSAWVVCVSTQAFSRPALLLLPTLGTPSELTVRGRVLSDAPTSGSSTLSRNLRRLAAGGLEEQKVQATLGDARAESVSGEDGAFDFE